SKAIWWSVGWIATDEKRCAAFSRIVRNTIIRAPP
ncbi:hypothetical protein F442_20868, partial [Phytophthora nicotianae P10297]